MGTLPSDKHRDPVWVQTEGGSCKEWGRVVLGGGLEGGLALQTPPVWFKRPSEPDSDLS